MILIDDLLMLPVRGLIGILKEIHEMAEREHSDKSYTREKLMELRLMYELDELSDEEYTKQEREMLARLDAIREDEYEGGMR